MADKSDNMLSPFRVLDLADEKGLLAGKILGDLGMDVIKVERPGGDIARSLGPFYHDEPHPEKSLFWFALNTSKRGITLNIETADGREIFNRMVEKADFVIEAFSPGYLDRLGLGYSGLEKINPGLIMVSITPFGQTGPYKDYKTSDIVAWAMGGNMLPWGHIDRPPIRVSHHSQSFLNAGADGAMGALMALYHRNTTGEGQQVDISIQEACSQDIPIPVATAWDLRKTIARRDEIPAGTNHRTTQMWRCKDGWVCCSHGGTAVLSPSLPLIKWMQSEGFTNSFIDAFDWTRSDFARISQEEMDQIEEPTGRFFIAHTKAELLEGAVKHEVMLYPVATTADMLENPQLAVRGYWTEIEHPELGMKITYPGAFGAFSETPLKITRRAPLIGEHNSEIYEDELGISKEEMVRFKQAGVI